MFDIDGFDKLWETEYLCDRLKRVTEEVRAGRYDNALDYLSMIQRKATEAEFFIKHPHLSTYNCPRCCGSGRIEMNSEEGEFAEICSDCKGTGRLKS